MRWTPAPGCGPTRWRSCSSRSAHARFGINVFKVREITQTPPITRAPHLPAGVEGVISLRGSVIPVISREFS